MIGYLAYSLSGHDKDRVYLIINEDKDFVYLADGDVRTTDRLKKKNKKHIQVIKKTGRRTEEACIRVAGAAYESPPRDTRGSPSAAGTACGSR